jgi:hypothetical protein
MQEADVICVVYAVNNVDSRENLRRRWLDVIVHELNLSVRFHIHALVGFLGWKKERSYRGRHVD